MDGSGPGPEMVLKLAGFSPGGGILHAFSTRASGVPAGAGAAPALAALLDAAGCPSRRQPVHLRQVHGATAHIVQEPTPSPLEGDGLATAAPGTVLVIQTADCLPALLADGTAGVVGAAHAGWRGALAGVLQATLARMEELGARRERVQAALGPAIGPCCFEVGEEVAAPFAALHAGLVLRDRTRPHVDLPGAARRLLVEAGVPPGAIHAAGACTRCQPRRFYSYRAEGPGTGRLLSVLGRFP